MINEKKDLKELRKKGKVLKPIINIGKKGINNNLLEQIKDNLRTKELIKIKLLKSVRLNNEKELLINTILKETKARLIYSIGNVFVIYKKKDNKK